MIGQVHNLDPGICDYVTMQINSTKYENESDCAAQCLSDVALILILITSETLFRALAMHQFMVLNLEKVIFFIQRKFLLRGW